MSVFDPKSIPVPAAKVGMRIGLCSRMDFGRDGKNGGTGGTTREDAYQASSNAWVTLMDSPVR
jgi:hypothetical protein